MEYTKIKSLFNNTDKLEHHSYVVIPYIFDLFVFNIHTCFVYMLKFVKLYLLTWLSELSQKASVLNKYMILTQIYSLIFNGLFSFYKGQNANAIIINGNLQFSIQWTVAEILVFTSRNKRNTRCIPFVPSHKTPEFLQLFINL